MVSRSMRIRSERSPSFGLSLAPSFAVSFCVFLLISLSSVTAQEAGQVEQQVDGTDSDTEQAQPLMAERVVNLSNGRLGLLAPEWWVKKKPRTNIVEFEFALPAVEGDTADGRLTIMGAGGGVEANVARWIGQFKAADGGAVTNAAEPAKNEVAGQVVHWVDLAGTYADKPRGPFGPTTEREGYRMLAAIIATKEHGQYFVKCYGPAKTIASAEAAFKEFIQSLKVGGADEG